MKCKICEVTIKDSHDPKITLAYLNYLRKLMNEWAHLKVSEYILNAVADPDIRLGATLLFWRDPDIRLGEFLFVSQYKTFVSS